MITNQEKTKEFWSKGIAARFYRTFAKRHFLRMHEYVARYLLALNPKDVLDVACGPGDFLAYLSSVDPKIHLVGVDIAPGMVAHAQATLKGKAEIHEASSDTQIFPDSSFDIVTIMMAFHHFPDKEKTLHIIKTILKSGGTLVIADVVARSDFQKRFWNMLEKASTIRGYVGHYTEQDLQALANKQGLSFVSEPVPGMAARYRACILKKT